MKITLTRNQNTVIIKEKKRVKYKKENIFYRG